MVRTFRQFMEEGEAAPAMGAGPGAPASPGKSPTEPDPNTHYDSSVFNREFGISDQDADKAIGQEGEMVLCTEPPTGLPQQPFIASAPIMLRVDKPYPDGSKDVTVMFTLSNKEKLMTHSGHKYTGPVKDISNIHLTKGELDRIRVGPMKSGGGAGGGAGGPGGAPPGGPGGAPPPPGGPAGGAPPM